MRKWQYAYLLFKFIILAKFPAWIFDIVTLTRTSFPGDCQTKPDAVQ
jgi:hypothetical protein